jgi:hypothetical protein
MRSELGDAWKPPTVEPDKLTFVIYWLDNAGFPDELPRPRIIGRDEVKRHDLSGAISAACNMLKAGKGNSDFAKGFTVKVKKGDDTQ